MDFQLEWRNRFETVLQLDGVDTMSETITNVIKQEAVNKPLISRISSPTRTVMTKRKIVGNGDGDGKQRLEYAEICKIIKKKEREDIRKYNQEIIRETIMTPKSLTKSETRPTQTNHTARQGRVEKSMITIIS